MIIQVTKADIRAGICGDCHQCPVAQAIANDLKVSRDDIFVAADHIKVLSVVYPTPVRVRRFVRKFDGGDKVEPFAFHLRRCEQRAAA
jgi:hypothetical protein